MKYPGVISPITCAKYPRHTVTIGVTINGIANIGLNTIGLPNIIGSFIPHISGTTQSLPKDFK